MGRAQGGGVVGVLRTCLVCWEQVTLERRLRHSDRVFQVLKAYFCVYLSDCQESHAGVGRGQPIEFGDTSER
jgi:hypothetical protein